MSGYRSRAEMILAVVPKCNIPSDDEDSSSSEVDLDDDQLQSRIEEFFDYLGADFNETYTDSLVGVPNLLPELQQANENQCLDVDTIIVDGAIGDSLLETGVIVEEIYHPPEFPDDAQPVPSSAEPMTPKHHLFPDDQEAGPSALCPPSISSVPQMVPKKMKKKAKPKRRSKRGSNKKKKTKAPRQVFNWQRGVPFLHEVTMPSPSEPKGNKSLFEPIEYFSQFFSEELVRHIVYQSNLYSTQKHLAAENKPKSKPVGSNRKKKKNSTQKTKPLKKKPEGRKATIIDTHDLYDFLAIEILTGIVQFPSLEDPWSRELRYAAVADIMPLQKYKSIRKILHFNDNTEEPSNDPYFKVRPLIEIVRKNCLATPGEERDYSIDEMMIPYKGKRAGSRRQYLKDKPVRWGIKAFVRSGVSGTVYDIILYGGQRTFEGIEFTAREQKFGVSAQAVVALAKTIPDPPMKLICFDNYYSSPGLMSYLREEYGLLTLGTIRPIRFPGLNFVDDKQLKRRGRGSFDVMVDNENKLAAVKWLDNKPVHIASNFCAAGISNVVNRWSKEEKKYVPVNRPDIISRYNEYMGGVDKSDQLISYYRTKKRSQKWYMCIWAQVLDLCINNAWLMYRRDFGLVGNRSDDDDDQDGGAPRKMALKEFRILLAKQLQLYERRPRGRPSQTTSAVPSKLSSPAEHKITPPRTKNKIPASKKNSTRLQRPKKQEPTISIPDSIRKDMVAHFPEATTRGRCRKCGEGRTTWRCSKCKLRLCLKTERNCFLSFHDD